MYVPRYAPAVLSEYAQYATCKNTTSRSLRLEDHGRFDHSKSYNDAKEGETLQSCLLQSTLEFKI